MTYRNGPNSKAIRHRGLKPMSGATGQTMQMYKTSVNKRYLKEWPKAVPSTGSSNSSGSEDNTEISSKTEF